MRNPEAFIENQYSGSRAGLRPIYEAVIAVCRKLGDDVVIVPKKEYVMVRRTKQFVIVFPCQTNPNQLELGLCLGNQPIALERSESFNSPITHRLHLSKPSDVDLTLQKYLQLAYSLA